MAAVTLSHGESLAAESRELLASLARLDWAPDFYLAGSAALALYLGHRPVRDLDLMSSFCRLRSSERRDLLQDLLAVDGDMRVETARDGFLYLRSGAGAAVRLYYYPYPLIEADGLFAGISVASLADLGLMKLGAVISRGTRRDFLDLYLLCQTLPLADLLEVSQNKFGHVGDFPLQALKGLADLSQIDGEPLPELSEPVEWAEIETWALGEVRTLGRRHVGLEETEED